MLDWVRVAGLSCTKGFGIYMIGILDSLSDVWKASTGTHHVTSSYNLLDNITRVLSQPSFSFCL